ncbi:hypothetical protein ACFYPT_19015 [Streptomyces sp. NPDC005529]
MPTDPYAVLRALLRAEAARDNAPEPNPRPLPRPDPDEQRPGSSPDTPRA